MQKLLFKSNLITKSLSEEKRLATFVVLEPQDADGTTNDLHLDWYDAETVEKACHNFNRTCRKANILHLMDTTGFEFIESYVTPSEMKIGDMVVKSGTWIATIYAEEDWIWDGIKDGTFNGLSIQAWGEKEEIE